MLETLRPAFDEIDGKIAMLTEVREKPAGTVRINASDQVAETLLWPKLKLLLPIYPDIHIELTAESGLTDIVAGRYDAGVRLGELVEKDMIAVRIGPDLRMVAVASPSYFARNPAPRTPHELAGHECINLRLPTLGGLYAWEFEKGDHELRVRVEGPLAFNSGRMIIAAAIEGYGLGYVTNDYADEAIRDVW